MRDSRSDRVWTVLEDRVVIAFRSHGLRQEAAVIFSRGDSIYDRREIVSRPPPYFLPRPRVNVNAVDRREH